MYTSFLAYISGLRQRQHDVKTPVLSPLLPAPGTLIHSMTAARGETGRGTMLYEAHTGPDPASGLCDASYALLVSQAAFRHPWDVDQLLQGRQLDERKEKQRMRLADTATNHQANKQAGEAGEDSVRRGVEER